ncbi:MAG TPA: tetratricopeptide repeat protein [Polyangiales bacterium]
MNADNLDIRLLRFRSRRDEYPHALATALLEAGRIPEALEVVQVGLLQSENDTALLVLEGRAWFEQGDLPQAQAALLRAAKVSPRDKEPYRWLAQVLMKRGEPGRAVQVLERALQIDPTDKALQQAHMRAQRLSRIANEAEIQEEQPAARSIPAPPPAAPVPPARPASPAVAAGRGSLPMPPARVPPPAPHIPAPPPAASRASLPSAGKAPAAAAPRVAPPPAPIARPPEPTPGRAEMRITERPRSSGAPGAKVSIPRAAPTPARDVPAAPRGRRQRDDLVEPPSPFDPTPDTSPPLELSRPLSRDSDADEDEPTVAAELPQELRSWLDAERSSHTELPAPTHSNNDNAALSPGGWQGGTDFSDDSEPTMAVHSGELRDAFLAAEEDDHPVGVFIENMEAEASVLGQPDAALAPPAEAEAPDQVLQLLEAQGIFERQSAPKETETWVPRAQAPRSGSRIGTNLAVGWLLALCAAGGGYYGFTHWLEVRRGDARALIERAQAEVRDGEYESLLAAERHLTQARSLDPKASDAVESLLFVHATRAIEDASGEMGYLRNSLARAREKQVAPALLAAIEALLAAYEGDAPGARAKAESALKLGGEDARILYLVGRLYQRAGLEEAGALLERATQLDDNLGLAFLARGEIAQQAGVLDRAKELFGKARGADGKELRAELWLIVMDTDKERAPALKAQLAGLAQRIERGSASDKLLALSARAGIALALGDVSGARAAVQEGKGLHGVRAPELTALFAERALAVGELDLAYRAANSTLRAAPGVRSYRDTLVSVLLRRGDGSAALSALAGITDDSGGSLLVAKGRAALLEGSRAALEEAKRSLAAFRASAEGKDDVDVAALLLRVDLHLGANGEALLPSARALAQRAQGASAPQLALAEAALAAHQPQLAQTALEKALGAAPDDADAHYLMGRAQRMQGRADAAREQLKQALAIAPSHVDARFALAALLLDAGDYDGAYELYNALERDGAGLSAAFGAAEALVGRGEVAGAELRLERLEAEDLARPGAQVLRARVALAKHKAGEAVKILEPLVREESEARTADVLALYGDALYADERVDSSAGAYDAAIELDEGHPDALVGRAMAALRAEKTSQATELAARADAALRTRVRPPRVHAALLLTQAKIEIAASEFSSAKEKLARAVNLAGVPPEAYFWYAETLAKTKTPGASESYGKYLELAPNGYFASRAKKALAPR